MNKEVDYAKQEFEHLAKIQKLEEMLGKAELKLYQQKQTWITIFEFLKDSLPKGNGVLYNYITRNLELMIDDIPDEDEKLRIIVNSITDEFIRTTNKYGPFHTAHEGYAVLLEEVDELWKNVKLKQTDSHRERLIANEAIHVAAMAIRLIYDCCNVHRLHSLSYNVDEEDD
jgi:hypothetical protein